MATWLTLDGMNCEDVGLYVLGYPPHCVPKRRSQVKNVPGGENAWLYDGSWGYEDMMLPVTFFYDGKGDADQAVAFLLPEKREIIFGDQPEYCYTGRVDEQIDFDKIFRERRACRFKVNFVCCPFRHLSAPGDSIVITDAGVITHQGTARCNPLLKVYGEGSGSIEFRGQERIDIQGIEAGEALVIDCAAMICTDAEYTINRSGSVTGPYPYLDPGENAIITTGGISRIEVAPRFAWIGR